MRAPIKTVTIVGLGALGVLVGQQLAKTMPREHLRVLADARRVERYRREGVFCNGERLDFRYVLPDEDTNTPADLIIVAVKYGDLKDAIRTVRRQVGENTLFVSLLNGITSEREIGEVYGPDKVVYAVAQGMDAVKQGNALTYKNSGTIFLGGPEDGMVPDSVRRVAEFFEKTGVPCSVDEHIHHRVWGKFMLNVGINQAVAVFGEGYRDAQQPGQTRETMIAAMHEVLPLARKEGIALTEDDITYWLIVIDGLHPDGKPSMRQDVEARRKSEVDIFAGTVLALSEKHGVDCPVNAMLYRRIKDIEAAY